MNFGSLFAGIGGFDLGFERAGMICSWQVEIDDYLTRVLEKHWPNVQKYKDVRDVGKENLKPVDLICGGFPCQPHSVAGKRKGAEDDRDLWPEYRRVIDELRPRWVVGENVPGIRTTILDQVLSDLEDMAYSTGTLNIPACAFDAPHRRERIFIIAYTNQNSEPNIAVDEQRKVSRTVDDTDAQRIRRNGKGTHAKGSKARDEPLYQLTSLDTNVADAWSNGRGQMEQSITGRTSGKETIHKITDSSIAEGRSWWSVEPDVGRVAHGIPSRVDRLRALGNAVVPQVAEFIGRQIMAVDRLTCVARCEDKN